MQTTKSTPANAPLSRISFRHVGPKQNRMSGLTIIQLMVILLIAGIVATLVVNALIDKRCADDPATKLCTGRKVAQP